MPTHTNDPARQPPTLRTEIIITLIGIAGVLLALSLFENVFSSAAIDLKLSRQEIIQRATDELVRMGYDPTGYEFALVFRQSGYASIYTERTLGVAETNRLLKSELLPLYYWSARWYRPLEKEEFAVELSSDGQLVTFRHIIPEDAPGADLAEAEARELAEAYLATLNWPLDQTRLLSASSELRPSERRDHTFTWERTDLEIGDGELRLQVVVHGDRADGYDYYLRVPDAFRRAFDTQRDRAGFLNGLALFLSIFGLGVAVSVAFLLAAFRRINLLRHIWPWALLVAVIVLLAELNVLPLAKYNYITTEDYTLFWMYHLINLPLLAIAIFTLLTVVWGGGNQISKLVWPLQDRVLPRGPNRWVEFSRATWRGLMISGWMFAYVVVFYYIANNLLGWWSPMDIPNVNLYATPFPFLAALEVGLFAGTWEELLFRLAGISLILWITRGRYTWLALLIPALIWAAAHAGYVTDPIYARVVELTIAAIFIEGLIFLRFGLLTTIIAHTAFNAGLTALPMLGSGEPYFVANGLAVLAFLALPLFPGLIITIRRKRNKEVAPAMLKIGPATPEDLPGLNSLPAANMDWEALLADPSATILCARQAGQVVGAAAGLIKEAGRAEVSQVVVAQAWRNQFLGSQLIESLRQQFQSGQAENIQVTLSLKDQRSTSFFASLGWQAATQTFIARSLPTFSQAVRGLWNELLEARKFQKVEK